MQRIDFAPNLYNRLGGFIKEILRGLDTLCRFPAFYYRGGGHLLWLPVCSSAYHTASDKGAVLKEKDVLQTSQEHVYIILTPLNPTFI